MGVWSKSSNGDWTFQESACYHRESVIITRNDHFEGVVEMTRIRHNLGILTPVALTYQLPHWMLLPDGPKTPLITLSCDKDIEIMTSVSDYMTEVVLYVTSGPELVAKYQFVFRSPFTISDTTYLQEGVTEEQHRQAIRDLVGGHPVVCSKHILELMFNEPQLLIIYRVALEIEMVYGIPNDDEENEDPAEFRSLTFDELSSMDEGVTIPPEDPTNYDPNLEAAKCIGVDQSTPLNVQPLNVWRATPHEDAYWDGMMDDETDYEVYLSQTPHSTEGVLGLPVAQNKKVSAPQPATIIITDDNDVSNTGSSDGINDKERPSTRRHGTLF
ncbi:hypothetical protein Bca4012_065819 [Brassica carinata]|uniref:Uncharacterized protein n=1 Tax=Brassica carinata TaxID=52824 RepID=A0A8X7VP68_BRACI|nr:hypothetical protein Bca52824_018138 [Brassica carinata]